MITVCCDASLDRYIISIDGHAEYAPVGQDTVCAAASVLTFALYRSACNFDTDGALSHFSHSISKGSAQFDIEVKGHSREEVRSAVDTVMEGFLLLEENFPEHVRVM